MRRFNGIVLLVSTGLLGSCVGGAEEGPHSHQSADHAKVGGDANAVGAVETSAVEPANGPPPRISVDPPTSEAKPPGWDANSCPGGQTAIVGTPGADVLVSSTGQTCLVGLEGDDVLTHLSGSGNRTSLGGPGDDTLTASSSTAVLADGGEGADHIVLFGGPNEAYGDIGDDLIYSGNDDDQVFGGPGDDDIFVSGGPDIVDAGEGNDYVLGGDLGDVVLGGPGNDHIVGGFGADQIDGGEGDDLILGYGGADLIRGGPGNDDIDALGFGGSTIEGNAGDDAINGSSSDDVIIPGPGADLVSAGLGDDIVVVEDACELVAGEVLDGGPLGSDTLWLPVSLAEAQAAGVIITGFETVERLTFPKRLSCPGSQQGNPLVDVDASIPPAVLVRWEDVPNPDDAAAKLDDPVFPLLVRSLSATPASVTLTLSLSAGGETQEITEAPLVLQPEAETIVPINVEDFGIPLVGIMSSATLRVAAEVRTLSGEIRATEFARKVFVHQERLVPIQVATATLMYGTGAYATRFASGNLGFWRMGVVEAYEDQPIPSNPSLTDLPLTSNQLGCELLTGEEIVDGKAPDPGACAQYRVCVALRPDVQDDHIGGRQVSVPGGVPARGVRYLIERADHPDDPQNGWLDTEGCFTFESDVNSGHTLTVWATSRFRESPRIEVKAFQNAMEGVGIPGFTEVCSALPAADPSCLPPAWTFHLNGLEPGVAPTFGDVDGAIGIAGGGVDNVGTVAWQMLAMAIDFLKRFEGLGALPPNDAVMNLMPNCFEEATGGSGASYALFDNVFIRGLTRVCPETEFVNPTNLTFGARCAEDLEPDDLPDAADVKLKFLYGHELGHWLQANWQEDPTAGIINRNESNYTAGPQDISAIPACGKSPPPLTGSVLHLIRSTEFAQGGLLEGIAQFISSVAYNPLVDASGFEQNEEALLRYYKLLRRSEDPVNDPFPYDDFVDPGLFRVSLVPDGPLGPLGGGRAWQETMCAADVGEQGRERSVELDWMRFWWDFATSDSLPGTKPTLPEILTFLAQVREDESDTPPGTAPTTWGENAAWTGFRTAFDLGAGLTGLTADDWPRFQAAGCANGVTNGIESCP